MVAAMGKNRVLGGGNKLLWRLSTDLKRYKSITMGKPMIMGRKTYQSIGHPLPGRQTIVLTRDSRFMEPGVLVVGSRDEALDVARLEAGRMKQDEIIIAGGQEIYTQFLPLADALRLTYVDASPQGDVWFPDFSEEDFREVFRQHIPAGDDDDHASIFVDLERIR